MGRKMKLNFLMKLIICKDYFLFYLLIYFYFLILFYLFFRARKRLLSANNSMNTSFDRASYKNNNLYSTKTFGLMRTADKSIGTIQSNRTSSQPSNNKTYGRNTNIVLNTNSNNIPYKRYVDSAKGKSARISGVSTKVKYYLILNILYFLFYIKIILYSII